MAAPANVTSYAKDQTTRAVLPRIADPAQLSGMVEEAIGRIGESAAAEIERQAEEIMAGATFVSDQLKGLAECIRDYTRRHGEEAAVFCGRMTSSYDVARQIAKSLRPTLTPEEEAGIETMEQEIQQKMPDFLLRALKEAGTGAAKAAPITNGSGGDGKANFTTTFPRG